jgi:uncharacterized membrane protein
MGIFIALAVALGFALASVPNLEMVTGTIFVAGYFLGSKKGALVGFIAEFLYSILNPYGLAVPPLLLAQSLSMALAGYVGGLLGQKDNPDEITTLKRVKFGTCGLLLTLIFDVVTTLSFAIFVGSSWQAITAVFLSGINFYTIHSLVNIGIFVLILPWLIRGLDEVEFLKKRVSTNSHL